MWRKLGEWPCQPEACKTATHDNNPLFRSILNPANGSHFLICFMRYYYCFTCIRNNWNQVSRCFTSNALSIKARRMCAWVFPILCPIRIAARMPVSITMARPGKQNAHVVISGVLYESPYIPSQITPTPHPIKHIKKHKHGSYAWFRTNIASDDCFVIVFIICIIHLVLLHGQV